jgi:hypothetical protein
MKKYNYIPKKIILEIYKIEIHPFQIFIIHLFILEERKKKL